MAYDYKKMFNASRKHVIVTGGAQGLSHGMAEGLLENSCRAVLADIQKGKLEAVREEYRVMGYEAYEAYGNLLDRADMDRIFTEVMKILDGELDVPVPAVGVQRRYLPEKFPIEEQDLVLNISLNAVFLMTQKVPKVVPEQATGGKVITIGSMVTWFEGITVPAYTASKGAIPQLTRNLTVDCAGRNININRICPGYMGVGMCVNVAQEWKDECTVRILAGCWETPGNLKEPVLLLASSTFDYLNGTTIPIDGGHSAKQIESGTASYNEWILSQTRTGVWEK